MVFLLDESNIHLPTGTSSIALVHVADLQELGKLDELVLSVERMLNIYPFHWSTSNWAVREKFIRTVYPRAASEIDFRVRVALLSNPVHIETALATTLPRLIAEREVQRLLIDGSKSKEYASRLKKVLRDNGITVKKLRTETDHARPALRVADFFAGLARHRADQPAGRAAILYQEVKPCIELTLEA
jgi:hypothetical protein